jgi:hypothetical protein
VRVASEGNEIKKPVSAFFHFSAEQRPAVAAALKVEFDAAADAATAASHAADPPEVHEEHGDATGPPPKKSGGRPARAAKKLGELWGALNEAAKAPYEARAVADAAR